MFFVCTVGPIYYPTCQIVCFSSFHVGPVGRCCITGLFPIIGQVIAVQGLLFFTSFIKNMCVPGTSMQIHKPAARSIPRLACCAVRMVGACLCPASASLAKSCWFSRHSSGSLFCCCLVRFFVLCYSFCSLLSSVFVVRFVLIFATTRDIIRIFFCSLFHSVISCYTAVFRSLFFRFLNYFVPSFLQFRALFRSDCNFVVHVCTRGIPCVNSFC